MKNIIAVFALIIIQLLAQAQSDITVVGQVFDKETGEPIPFASVSFFTMDRKLVTGNITTEDGRFSIRSIGSGQYKMVVASVGYTSLEQEVLIGRLNTHYDMGKLRMSPSLVQLADVVVTGDHEEISEEMDKKSYNMDQNISQSGGSVMDAMKAMPSVSFDQEGKVVLRGSDKVIVLIDGKQSSLTGFGNQKGLDNIPAANIEHIEIINNPSAKYDATGMAGIINIVYKKETQDGLHGSVGMAYGLGAITRRQADLPTRLGSYSPTPKYIPSLDLNYRKGKTNFFMQSEVLFQQRLPNNEFTKRIYDDGRQISSQVPENRSQTHYIVKGGIEHTLDEHNILTLSGIYDWESHVDTAQVAYIDANQTRQRYITWNEEEITGYLNYTLAYEHKFAQTGHTIRTSAQYAKGWEDETYFINDSSVIRTKGRDVTTVLGTEHITTGTLDYTRPTATGRIESGVKVRIRYLPVEYEQERGQNSTLYEGLGNWSRWQERVYAAYVNLVHEKPKYDIEGGVRAEYTTVSYDMDETNTYYQSNDAYSYFRLFPSIRLTYKIDESNRLSAFVNQRIDRPGEPELRIYTKSDDHELVKVGNPYLRPQFTTTTELAYQHYWHTGSVFISGYYRQIEDTYQRVYVPDTTSVYDVVVKGYANTGLMRHLGGELVFSQEMGDRWKLSGNLNAYQIDIDRHVGQLQFPYVQSYLIERSTDITWDAKLVNTLKVNKGLELQLTALYYAPKDIPQGRQAARSSMDIGAKQKLWQNKGELTLAATDLFNRYGISQRIQGQGFISEYQNFYETQTVRIALKYKF